MVHPWVCRIRHGNAFRLQEGRPPIAPNLQLTAAAHDFATFMVGPASSATQPMARGRRSERGRTALTPES
jgi:hypothetical protein